MSDELLKHLYPTTTETDRQIVSLLLCRHEAHYWHLFAISGYPRSDFVNSMRILTSMGIVIKYRRGHNKFVKLSTVARRQINLKRKDIDIIKWQRKLRSLRQQLKEIYAEQDSLVAYDDSPAAERCRHNIVVISRKIDNYETKLKSRGVLR